MSKWDKYKVTESPTSKWDKYRVDSKSEVKTPTLEPVDTQSLFNEFSKANEQLSAGARANLQGRSFQSGFQNPQSVQRFQDTMPQGVMNLLEKSKFLREHPNAEQALFQTLGAPAKLAGIATDTLTNPMDVAGTIVGGRLLQKAVPMVSNAQDAFQNFISKGSGKIASKLGLNYQEKLAGLKAQEALIGQTAAKEIAASEAQVSYNIGNLKQAKAQSLDTMNNLTREAEKLNAEAIAKNESQSLALGTKLPDVAYSTGQKVKEKFINVISKHSQEYRTGLNKLFGGKGNDIFVDRSKFTSSIEDALAERNVATSISEEGKLIASGPVSPAEQKLINFYNKISKQESLGLREVLKDKQMLGRAVKYGKAYGYEDDLINDVVQRLGSRLEKEIPGLKQLNQSTSKFLRIKDEANARLDLFKQGSEKPRKFVESFAKSNMTPEERVFLEKFRKELPDFDSLSKAPRALGEGMKQYDDAIKMLNNKDPKVVEKVVADFDTEIAKLNSNLDIIKARLSNKATTDTKPLTESIAKIEKKLSRIKKVKDTIITVGSTGALGYGAVRALNYGYNSLFKD